MFAFAVHKAVADVVDCHRVVLLCGESVPIKRHFVVFLDAESVFVHNAQVILSKGIAALRRFFQKFESVFIVFGNTEPCKEANAKIRKRAGVSLRRSLDEPVKPFFVVKLNAVALHISGAEFVLSVGVAAAGALFQRKGRVVGFGDGVVVVVQKLIDVEIFHK